MESGTWYVVKPGDYLAKVGADHDTTWQEIWRHPANAEHRRRRRSPDVLYAGDRLFIPSDLLAEPPPNVDVPIPEIPPQPPEEPPWPYPKADEPPDPLASRPTWQCPTGECECGSSTPIELGADFLVLTHWGIVPMFDSSTIVGNPPSQWRRISNGFDDGLDYSTFSRSERPLHYRLEPPPYQDAATFAQNDPERVDLANLSAHFVEAGKLFRVIYEFFARDYSDIGHGTLPNGEPTPVLGPQPSTPPTPISSNHGHFIIHPDYHKVGSDDGRHAHANHIHAQLGPTDHGFIRTN